MMERFRNVIVFGDSFSDIGKKRHTKKGRFAYKTGLMTTSPSGRFSDCRTWADFMFRDATGTDLVGGSVQQTYANSKPHMKISTAPKSQGYGAETWFYYANYAEGGATGTETYSFNWRRLGTFKEQVKDFKSHWKTMQKKRRWLQSFGNQGDDANRTLFIIWFGANDVYTTGRPSNKMREVAVQVADIQRMELARVVGDDNAEFLFISVPKPLNTPKYRMMNDFDGRDKSVALIRQYKESARVYNHFLKSSAHKYGDMYFDINNYICESFASEMSEEYGINAKHYQPQGHSDVHRGPNHPDLAWDKQQQGTTSDMIHPSDRMHEYVWDRMYELMYKNKVRFGKLGPPTLAPIQMPNNPAQPAVLNRSFNAPNQGVPRGSEPRDMPLM